MYITNIDEVVPVLRERLRDYLVLKLGIEPNAKKINCFIHKDTNPSMYFNPKTRDQTAHCFSCGAEVDIFAAAAALEGLPESGPEWIKTTIPHIAELLEIPVKVGEPSALDQKKLKLYRLSQDISDILASTKAINEEYLQSRNWLTDELIAGSISEEELMSKLVQKKWDPEYLISSMVIKTARHSFFGQDKITFVIKDFRSRPIAFVSRNIEGEANKYINSCENLIYEKGKTLLGLDVALKKGEAKKQGIIIVEGVGDLVQLYRLGIFNAVAICGTAFTQEHANILKTLSINRFFFSLDWDSPGAIATSRILKTELSGVTSVSCLVSEPIENYNDLDDYLKDKTTKESFTKVKFIPAFEWLMKNISDNQDAVDICAELIPSIAAESTAVQRDRLIRILSDYTRVSAQAIRVDVESIRNSSLEERKEKLKAAAQNYVKSIEKDPENIQSLISQHESDISNIEKEYQRDVVGVNYQLSRYEALQMKRMREAEEEGSTDFIYTKHKRWGAAFSGSTDATSGVLIYLGGRPNSGKTATGIGIAVDIAMSDPNAIVIGHFIDDNYVQVEPRFKSNIAEMLRTGDQTKLSIGKLVNPVARCTSQEEFNLYERANDKLKDLISSEKLILLDAEDGMILSTVEKHLKYVRSRNPDKKIFVFCDNTHRYKDWPNLDPRSKMTKISDLQKELTMKYGCCILATVEYRKSPTGYTTELKLPVDDDIADARALTYNANGIVHVYNDLNDRKENAETFWMKDNEKQPRVQLLFSKNKIASFKGQVIMDIDSETVTLKEIPGEQALNDWQRYNNIETKNESFYYVDAE